MTPEIVAEIGAAHNGSLGRLLETIDAAKGAGADSIKLQVYRPETMVADRSYVIPAGPWAGRNLFELYAEGSFPWEWLPEIFAFGRLRGIEVFATPFDETAVEALEAVDCPRYKIASCELTDIPLIRYVRSTGKPIVISTGMGTVREIADAAAAAFGVPITLLKCTSAYPAPADEMNLATIPDMRQRFGYPVGLSDHSRGAGNAAVIATVLGATMIEKHITLEPSGGLDDGFAIDPGVFQYMCLHIRAAAQVLGEISYGGTESEMETVNLRRGLYAVADLQPGDAITRENIKARRPEGGILPYRLDGLVGLTVKEHVKAGTALQINMIAPR